MLSVLSGNLSPLGVGRRRGGSYKDKVLATAPVAYWILNDLTGTQATDYSGNGRHGTYSGAALGGATWLDGSAAASFDGVNDYVNVYSALSGALNVNTGTVLAWARVGDAGVWSDGAARAVFTFGNATLSQRIAFQRLSSNGTLRWRYDGGFANRCGLADTDWMALALTWDTAADEAKGFFGGAQVGATQTGLGTVSLNSSYTVLGADSVGGTQMWYGALAHIAVWDAALSAGQIASLSIAA